MWKFCPHCGGDLTAQVHTKQPVVSPRPEEAPLPPVPVALAPYNQTSHWKALHHELELLGGAVPSTADHVGRLVKQKTAWLISQNTAEFAINSENADNQFESIVHMIFDQSVTPRGGVLHQAVVSGSKMGVDDVDRLTTFGYVLVDGKVQHVDSVPVGKGYGLLQYWGGEKQRHRWHMDRPIEVNPSRSGDPCFMDEIMVAFRVYWRDLERFSEAMANLINLFKVGPDGQLTATPLIVDIFWQ